MGITNKRLFHYSVGLYLDEIIKVGNLLPADCYLDPGERPALWLSENCFYEATARKGWFQANGNWRRLTMCETHLMCGGLIRFVISPDVSTHNLLAFRDLSGVSEQGFKHLIQEGRRQKANPWDWHVTFEPIPLSSVNALEAWDGRHWVDTGWNANPDESSKSKEE